jgi:large subunit ribosomal protein L25
MKISFELVAEFREDQGKGASRRLRHLGKVPAILYGGKRDARVLVDHTKLAQLMDNERFYSTILALKVGSQQQAAVLKDVQRHPYKNQIVHIDFQRVLEDEKIKMQVPLHFKGGAESKGVKEQGGVLSHVRNDVEVTCLPKDLPEFVEVDVSGLEINQVVKLSNLKLPAGVDLVDLLAKRDGPVASIHMPRVEEEETPVVDEAAAAALPPARRAPLLPRRSGRSGAAPPAPRRLRALHPPRTRRALPPRVARTRRRATARSKVWRDYRCNWSSALAIRASNTRTRATTRGSGSSTSWRAGMTSA